MNLEIPNELAEHIADLVGNYKLCETKDHKTDCDCRMCFVTSMEHRIIESVRNFDCLFQPD